MSATPPAFPFDAADDGTTITVRFPAGTELTEANADLLQRELLALAAGRDHPHLTVDLSGITILTSVVLGKFLAVNKQVRAASGRLTLLNPTATVRTVFTVTRLDTVLDIQQTGMPA